MFLRHLRTALEYEHAAAGALAICLVYEKADAEIAEGLAVSACVCLPAGPRS